MRYRCFLPEWAAEEYPDRPRVIEDNFTDEELIALNEQYYNIHNLPNYPKDFEGTFVDGADIDTFEWVYVDMDLKDKVYPDKETFINLIQSEKLPPTKIIDSGNGCHVYWRVTDLDAMAYLRLQRRLIRKFKTDEAVAKIFQLMRPPGFVNTKHKGEFKMCVEVFSSDKTYTCEELDKLLPPITLQDEEYCKTHYNKTYKLEDQNYQVDDKLPLKFAHLLNNNNEVKQLWGSPLEDRSKADYRLGHIMFAHGFTKEEAMSVLVNTSKALSRAPIHRINYAKGIVDKIWTFELDSGKKDLNLSMSVRDILSKSGDTLKGTRFPCWRYLDATHHGFRLGQVIGLVAGSGVGKTAVALNMFEGFVKNNPDYVHFFIPLEQPANEIADRWRTMCGENTSLHDKVHVISNYDEDGAYRNLSLEEIKAYILKFQETTKLKAGCVVIDHIGALKKKSKDGRQSIEDICHEMKAFAIQTNTLLVMQSQTNREKAGIGDLELNKDAAFGTVFFESYCDYLITIWQPLKRCYNEEGCPTVTAFKFCKIRHKKRGLDEIQEDMCYRLYFDSNTERLREMNITEENAFAFFANKALNLRKQDRKTDLVPYKSITWTDNANSSYHQDKR